MQWVMSGYECCNRTDQNPSTRKHSRSLTSANVQQTVARLWLFASRRARSIGEVWPRDTRLDRAHPTPRDPSAC